MWNKTSLAGKFKIAILFLGLIVMLAGLPYYIIIIYVSLALAVVSFFNYFWKFRGVLLL